jgi:hypothetical protein
MSASIVPIALGMNEPWGMSISRNVCLALSDDSSTSQQRFPVSLPFISPSLVLLLETVA